MMSRFAGVLLAATILASTSTVEAQSPPVSRSAPSAPSLTIRGLDGSEHLFTASELARLRRVDTTVSAHMVSGRYGGVLLSELLSLAGAPHGDSLRGKALATYMVVVGADGYRVVFGLADFDPAFTDRIAILADTKDGSALPAGEGPYHLIIPGERRPARWVRQVVRIELQRAP